MAYSSWYKPQYSWETYQGSFTPIVEEKPIFDINKAIQWVEESFKKQWERLATVDTMQWENPIVRWLNIFWEWVKWGWWVASTVATSPITAIFSWFAWEDDWTQWWIMKATSKVFWQIEKTSWDIAEYVLPWNKATSRMFWEGIVNAAMWEIWTRWISKINKWIKAKVIQSTTKEDILKTLDNKIKEEAWIFWDKIDTSSTMRTIEDYLTKVEKTPTYTNPFKVIDDLHTQWITNLDEPIKTFIDNTNQAKWKIQSTKTIFKALWDDIQITDKNWIPIIWKVKLPTKEKTKVKNIVDEIIPDDWVTLPVDTYRTKITSAIPILDEILLLNKNDIWNIIRDTKYEDLVNKLQENYPVDIEIKSKPKFYMDLVNSVYTRADEYKKNMDIFNEFNLSIDSGDYKWANELLKSLNPKNEVVKVLDDINALKDKIKTLTQPWAKARLWVELNQKVNDLKNRIKKSTPDEIMNYSIKDYNKFNEDFYNVMNESNLYPKADNIKWEYLPKQNLIKLFSKGQSIDTILHEFSHHLTKYISPQVYTKIKEIYTKEFTDLVNKYWKTAIEKELVWKILRWEEITIENYTKGKSFANVIEITSFYDNAKKLLSTDDLYRYTNVAEFIAEELKDAFIRGQQKKWFIQKIVDFLKWLFIKSKKALFDKEAHSFLTGKAREIIDESRLPNESYLKKLKWNAKEEDLRWAIFKPLKDKEFSELPEGELFLDDFIINKEIKDKLLWELKKLNKLENEESNIWKKKQLKLRISEITKRKLQLEEDEIFLAELNKWVKNQWWIISAWQVKDLFKAFLTNKELFNTRLSRFNSTIADKIKSNFTKRFEANKVKYEARIVRLKEWFKKRMKAFKDKNKEKIKVLRKNLNEKIIQERLRQKDYKNLKYSILQSFHIAILNWDLHINVKPLLYKLSKSAEFIKANSLNQINEVFKKYEAEIKVMDFNSVYDDIVKLTKNYIDLTKLQKKGKITIWARQDLADIISILESSKETMDIVKLRQLKETVKQIIAEWKQAERLRVQDILDTAYDIIHDKNLKVTKIETYKDITKYDTKLEMAKKLYKSFYSVTDIWIRIIWKMFWTESKIYKFFNNTLFLEQNMEKRIFNEIIPLQKKLYELFNWDEVLLRRFTIWMFTKGEFWFKKLLNDPNLLRDLFYDNNKSLKRTTAINKEIQDWFDFELLNRELKFEDKEWKIHTIKTKDSVIMEEIEKFMTDKTYDQAIKIWQPVFASLHRSTSFVLEQTEWTILKKDDNYTPYIITESYKPKEINFQWEEAFSQPKPDDFFTKDKMDTDYKPISYEYNPIKILEKSWDKMTRFIYLKEHFNQMKAILYWKVTKINKLTADELESYINKEGYIFADSMGKEITIQERLPNWNMIIEGREYWFKSLQEKRAEDIWIRKPSEWIINSVGKGWKKLLEDWLENTAGVSDYSGDAMNMLSRILKQWASVPLVFKPSAVTRQYLSYWDAAHYLGRENLMDTNKELRGNKELAEWLNDAVPAIHQRSWQQAWLYDEIWIRNFEWGKAHKLYSKYRDFWLKFLKEADKSVFETIWLTAYKQNLIKKGKVFKPFDDLDIDAIMEATDLSERLMYTSSKINQPAILKNPIFRSIFSLSMPVISRYWQFTEEYGKLYWKGEKYAAMQYAVQYAWMNLVEYAFTPVSLYLLYQLWLTQNDTYSTGEKVAEWLFSAWTAFNITLGQNPLIWKTSSVLQYWNLSLYQWMWDNNKVALKQLVKWEDKYWNEADRINWLIDFINQSFIGTPWKYLKSELINAWILSK